MKCLRLAAVCVLTVLASILIHEAGHALAGYLTGNRVVSVVLFSVRPHVLLEGASTPEQTAFKAAAGTALFLAAWGLLIWLAPRGGAAMSAVVSAASLIAFVESVGWMLSALLHPYGPRSEDGWKFLTNFGMPPLLMAALALTVAGFAWRIFFSGRTVPEKVLPVASRGA
jgi:hypothetical protein